MAFEADLAALATISSTTGGRWRGRVILLGRLQVQSLVHGLVSVVVQVVVLVAVAVCLGSKPDAALSAFKIRSHCYVEYVDQECVAVRLELC